MNIISWIIVVSVSILGLVVICGTAYETISIYRLLKVSEDIKEQLIEVCKVKEKENK